MNTTLLAILLVAQFFYLAAGHYTFLVFLGNHGRGPLATISAYIYGSLALAVPWSVYASQTGMDPGASPIAVLWLFLSTAGAFTAFFYGVDHVVATYKRAHLGQ